MSNAWARHPETDSPKLSQCGKTNGFCPQFTVYGSPSFPSLGSASVMRLNNKLNKGIEGRKFFQNINERHKE